MGTDYKGKMITYICCKRGGNNCPKRDECRRYMNADIGVSWNLFKHVCTEKDNYQLFMEMEETTELVPINNGQDSSDATRNEDGNE